MNESLTGSAAFEVALLRSERLRLLGVAGVFLFTCTAIALRVYVLGSAMSRWGIVFLILFIAYEAFVFRLVEQAIKGLRRIPRWFWHVNMMLEMLVPALGTAFLISNRIEPAYRPLATPWVLVFFTFIILSTLRLNPLTCFAAGATGAVGYLGAAMVHGWRLPEQLSASSVTQSAVPFFASVIFGSGLVAALVSREIRKHLDAALREAETERQLEQVEHDLKIARSIQQSLLPKVRPDIAGFEIAGWNRSADATGGDYFDWKLLSDGRLVVTLADVTGHGIGPALLAAICRAYARATIDGHSALPVSMQSINQSFGEDLLPGRFATFVAAICKADCADVELLSAGHGPLFLFKREEGALQEFAAHAFPLGLFPDLNLQAAQCVHLDEGDMILLITDGFFEWENAAGEQFGTTRLAEVIRRTSHSGPEEIIAELYAAVLAFAGGTVQQDDLTAVVIKHTATAAHVEESQLAAAAT